MCVVCITACLCYVAQVKSAEDCDTLFSTGSLKGALRAAGSVVRAVDAVVSGSYRNAFCCVRPPGHHAGITGLIKDAVSCGFCIFNSIMIGALYALDKYSDLPRPPLGAGTDIASFTHHDTKVPSPSPILLPVSVSPVRAPGEVQDVDLAPRTLSRSLNTSETGTMDRFFAFSITLT